MRTKDTYVIKVWDSDNPQTAGWGECALFKGLSKEDTPEYEDILGETCRDIHLLAADNLPEISSIRFGFEMALADLGNGGDGIFFDSPFAFGKRDITINGLIWMGDKQLMANRIKEKLNSGFHCIKLKIGGINFEEEVDLLKMIRQSFPPDVIELRLDANGSFSPENALSRLERLSEFSIHSIEQPIRPGNPLAMASLVKESPIPIALDEELIGFSPLPEKEALIREIKPDYIILKPSLCGGFGEASQWIEVAQKNGVGWWATSALESNLGLMAIAQWVDQYTTKMPQGLGTGQLYLNNFISSLYLDGQKLKTSVPVNVNIPDSIWQK